MYAPTVGARGFYNVQSNTVLKCHPIGPGGVAYEPSRETNRLHPQNPLIRRVRVSIIHIIGVVIEARGYVGQVCPICRAGAGGNSRPDSRCCIRQVRERSNKGSSIRPLNIVGAVLVDVRRHVRQVVVRA